MDLIEYNDLKHICRMCLLTCNNKYLPNIVTSDIYCKLTGISFDLNIELPQQICETCFAKIMDINAISSQWKHSHSILMNCLDKYKSEGINEAQITVKTEYLTPDEFEIVEHNVEFVNVENEQIKQEFIDETDELNNENEAKQDMPHLQNDTTSGSCSYSCEICAKTFNQLSNLNVHKRIHKGERPYACEICKKSFTQLINLKDHRRIHSGERPFQCDICHKTFTHSSTLNRHKRIHSGERPYSCDTCQKTFNQSSSLNDHKRIHSGERPFACDICNKTFIHSSDLNKHKHVHSGERPYMCEICQKTFIHSSHFNKHKRLHSSERP